MKTYYVTYEEGFTGEVKTFSIKTNSEERAVNYFKSAIVPAARWGAQFISITSN